MKPEREQLSTERQSFRLLLDPNLNDVFYWHFHPEVEIVYVEAEQGFRHIGDHLFRYEGSDLAMIGPNIPHLNFDYGVKTKVGTVVLQMREDFLGREFLELQQTHRIRDLFQRARTGLAFSGATKAKVGSLLKSLPEQDDFRQLLTVLEILNLLAGSEDFEDLKARPVSGVAGQREQDRLNRVYRLVEEKFCDDLGVAQASDLCCMTVPAFCRYFKKASGYTFTDFLNRYRVNQARKLLLRNATVADACELCGFRNFSHFSKTFRRFTGESPSAFRKMPRSS